MEIEKAGEHGMIWRYYMNGVGFGRCWRCNVEALPFETFEAACPGRNVSVWVGYMGEGNLWARLPRSMTQTLAS